MKDESLSLYGITTELLEQIDSLMSIDGQTEEESQERYNELAELFHKKISACTGYLIAKKSRQQLIKSRIEDLKVMLAKEEKFEESFSKYILMNMIRMWQMSIDTPNGKLSIRKSSSVDIVDESVIPEEYLNTRTIVETKPDKNKIKEALSNSIEVPGCIIKINDNLNLK